jgi:hypothetical protein
MPTTTLTAHLSTAELGQRYRAAQCPLERSHLQIIWLLWTSPLVVEGRDQNVMRPGAW